jgi:hypothetical protein
MRVIKLICLFGKSEYFCKRGWTGKSADNPTGKSGGVAGSSNSAIWPVPRRTSEMRVISNLDYLAQMFDADTQLL